jgi:hypothetical protein
MIAACVGGGLTARRFGSPGLVRNARRSLMAVGVVLEFAAATLDQYDQLVEKMGFSPSGGARLGALSLGDTDRRRHPGDRRLAGSRDVRAVRAGADRPVDR